MIVAPVKLLLHPPTEYTAAHISTNQLHGLKNACTNTNVTAWGKNPGFAGDAGDAHATLTAREQHLLAYTLCKSWS